MGSLALISLSVFLMVILVSGVHGNTCRCTCGGTATAAGPEPRSGYWGAAEYLNNPDPENQSSDGSDEQIPEGFSGAVENRRKSSKSTLPASCSNQGGSCVEPKICGPGGPTLEDTDCASNTLNGKTVCCHLVFRKR